ncbi:MAG: ABC transporter ATP-binding protein/permease [Lachnospiraceae bacterium]|nr:ABC transporter ATP-binding protein/permease [Lachnospiraceae bacterium]
MKAALDILKKLNYVLNAKQKRQYVFVVIIALIGSMFELLGVAAVMPFVESVMSSETAEQKWYTALVRRFVPVSDPMELITILGLFIIAVFVIKNIYLMFSTYIQVWYSTSVQKELSVRMTRTYLESSYLFHLANNSAVLIRSVNQDVVGVFGMFYYIFRIVSEFFTIISIGVYVVTLDPFLAISLMLILGSCMVVLFFGLKKLMKYFGKQEQNCEGRMLQYLTQAFRGIKEIMVKHREEYFIDSFEEASAQSARATKINYFLNAITTNIYEMVCIGGLFAIVILRLRVVDDVTAFITRLATVAMAAFRLFPSVGRLTTNLNGIVYNRSRLDYLYENMKKIEEDDEYLHKQIEKEDQSELHFEDKVELKDIRWRYPEGKKDILAKMNLTIKKGESVALIGPSGAGKTTLADVMLGLLHPQEGQILVDGTDIYGRTAAWAGLIGYVPQAVYLTDDTIRANVAFGIREEDIDDEKVWRALEEAQLADYIRSQDDGLDTMVGESGVRLSGGQRQRIAIARALYDDPEILVLDEATSALDTETETAVMEAIDSLHGSKTLLIVAHRLTTIRNCDSIYEVNGGTTTLKDKRKILEGIA